MIQIYLVSVVVNLLAGITLAYGFLDTRLPLSSALNGELFEQPRFWFGLGSVSFIVGFLKLLSGVAEMPVIGDLLPAIAGLMMGMTLLVQFYRSRADVVPDAVVTLEKVFVANKTAVGIVGIVVALVHFLFPRILFL